MNTSKGIFSSVIKSPNFLLKTSLRSKKKFSKKENITKTPLSLFQYQQMTWYNNNKPEIFRVSRMYDHLMMVPQIVCNRSLMKRKLLYTFYEFFMIHIPKDINAHMRRVLTFLFMDFTFRLMIFSLFVTCIFVGSNHAKRTCFLSSGGFLWHLIKY